MKKELSYSDYLIDYERRTLAATGQLPPMPNISIKRVGTAFRAVPMLPTVGPLKSPDSDDSSKPAKKRSGWHLHRSPRPQKKKVYDHAAYKRNKETAIDLLGGACAICGGTEQLFFRYKKPPVDGKSRHTPITSYLHAKIFTPHLTDKVRQTVLICRSHSGPVVKSFLEALD